VKVRIETREGKRNWEARRRRGVRITRVRGDAVEGEREDGQRGGR